LTASRWALMVAMITALVQLAGRSAVAQEAAGSAGPASASSTAPVPVDQQPSREQLQKLFDVMRLRQQMDAFLKRIPALVQQQIRAQTKQMAASLPNGGTLTPDQQAAVDRITTRYMQRALNVFTIDEVIDELIPIYQRHLTKSDVDAFIAFYESPAGQHLLDQQPAIMEEYMPLALKHAQERSKALTDELIRELTAAVKQPAPAGDKPVQK